MALTKPMNQQAAQKSIPTMRTIQPMRGIQWVTMPSRVMASQMTRDWLRWNRLPARSPIKKATSRPGQDK